MNKLLIHANNTSLNTSGLFSLEEEYVLEVPLDTEEIDLYLHDLLTNGSLNEQVTRAGIVFIKIALTQNYLELLGLRLAHHIRLTEALGDKRQLPLVLVCEETPVEIVRLSNLGSILFTSGVYTIKEDRAEATFLLEQYSAGKVPGVQDLKKYLSRIVIDAPASYQSHHSIANEWSILRWARVLQLDEATEALKRIKGNIEGLLYYKYLTAILPISSDPNTSKFPIPGTAKILYIDDEWSKGWDYVLQSFLSLSPQLKDALSVLKDLKDKSPEEIVQRVAAEMKAVEPDIILLDLRLCEEDFKESRKAKELTGYRVLERIKRGRYSAKGTFLKEPLNPGVQVLIFTASNKVWNLLELQKCGANGFVLKEAPEQSTDKDYARETIASFKSQLEQTISRTYLKKLWLETQEIIAKLKEKCSSKKISKEFYQATVNWLELSFSNLDSYLEAKCITSFILYFSILESINNELINEEVYELQTNGKVKYQFRSKYRYLKEFDKVTLDPKGDLELDPGKRIPWEVKILNAAYFLEVINSDFKKLKALIEKRHELIHQNLVHSKSVSIDEGDVRTLFSILRCMLMNMGA